MKFPLAAAAMLGLLALAGCATGDDLAKRDPVFYGSSARNAQDYSDCVVAAWQGQGGEVARHPIQDGFRVTSSSSISVEGVLDVITYRGKTEIKMYTRLPERGRDLVEAANLCM